MHFPATSLFLLSLLAATGIATPTFGGKGPGKKVPKGFVYTEGTKFKLDGKDFHFAGSNAYYLPFHNNETDTYLGLVAAKKAGLKVMRTWGFYDLNTTHIPADQGGMPQYGGEGAGPTTVHFQSWKKGKPTINRGKNGLQVFDGVVRAAEKAGVKLVVALTNNWADYGGMDMYTINLLGGNAKHDDFYTSPVVQKYFKEYVKAVVTRYTKSPAILGWQLANEPRCGADGVRNLPRSEGKKCNHKVITKWAKETSQYIKKLDPHHLVSTGSEGEFNFPEDPDWAYSSADGGDFYAEVALDTIDYGTFHLYPDWWSKTSAWGTKWIHDHADAQEKLNKPVVLEEYGWLSPEKRLEYLGTVSNETRTDVLGAWQKAVVDRKLAGDQYWQYGWSGWSYGRNHDDGFTIFSDDAEAKQLIYQHAKNMEKLNKGGRK